jgi:hypothetical protein
MPYASFFGLSAFTNSIPIDPPFPRLLHLSKEIYPRILFPIDQIIEAFFFHCFSLPSRGFPDNDSGAGWQGPSFSVANLSPDSTSPIPPGLA